MLKLIPCHFSKFLFLLIKIIALNDVANVLPRDQDFRPALEQRGGTGKVCRKSYGDQNKSTNEWHEASEFSR